MALYVGGTVNFGDNEEGEIYESGVDEEGDGAWYINSFMREILGKDESTGISEQYQHTTPLKNQTDGQLNLFPTGTVYEELLLIGCVIASPSNPSGYKKSHPPPAPAIIFAIAVESRLDVDEEPPPPQPAK